MKKRLILAAVSASLFITGTSVFLPIPETVKASGNRADDVKIPEAPKSSGNPEDEEYIYCVGSVSKVYVTAAVMKLIDEGKVKLDFPVTAYIPDFRMEDERYRDITVRMLMDHTSGIMGTTQPGAFCYDTNTFRQELFSELLSAQRLKADPGKYACYCNDGFDLLALIVENVAGMTFTDYVQKEIAEPCGGKSTGTAMNYLSLGTPAHAYTPENLPMDFGVTLALGAGGVYSKASDVADFGAAFFKGSTILLSEEAKNRMAVRWDAPAETDPFKDENGLGWDQVQVSGYDKAGVQVLVKGGDANLNHAILTVAPEEEISVSVLSNGGSSLLNSFVATAILDAVLQERGIKKAEKERPDFALKAEIPGEYDEYEGFYASFDTEMNSVISHVTFPGHQYMHVENIGPFKKTVTDYMMIDSEDPDFDGKFAELAYELETDGENAPAEVLSKARPAVNPMVLSFVKDSKGEIFFRAEYDTVCSGLGRAEKKKYAGEKMKENPVSDKVLKTWEDACSEDFLLCNDTISSSGYGNAVAKGVLSKEMPGYIYLSLGQWGSRVLKLTDESHAEAFLTIPSSSNRDLTDVCLASDETGTKLILSTGLEYISKKDIPVLDGTISEIELKKDKASWFRIGDTLANSSVSVSRPEGSHIYVYNKYGSVVYTTHVKDAGNDLPLPADSVVVFLGNSMDTVQIR